jgi:hypothetical protein
VERVTSAFVTVTVTSKKRDKRTGKRLRWSYILSDGQAEACAAHWLAQGATVAFSGAPR